MLASRKLSRLIRSLLPTSSEPLNFNMLLGSDGAHFRTESKTDRAAAYTMKDWMAIPASLHPVALSLEDDPQLWLRLPLDGTMPLSPDLPHDIQQSIIQACGKRHIPDAVAAELHQAMQFPFTYKEFNHCRKSLAPGKSPGPSGLTSTQVKHWGDAMTHYVHDLSSVMWAHHHIPGWWQDREANESSPQSTRDT